MIANACMTDYTECMRNDAFAPSEFSCAEFNTVNVQSTAVMAVLCFSLISLIFRISIINVSAVISGIIIIATVFFLLIILSLRRDASQSRL